MRVPCESCGDLWPSRRDADLLCTCPSKIKGKKNDSGKLRYSLLHQPTLWGVVAVLEHGASKYGDRNYLKVENHRERYFNAAQRHLKAWWGGEKVDPESGLPHLHHALASLFFLSERDDEGA